MSSELRKIVYQHVSNPEVAGLVIETELTPLGGPSTPIAPPTYAREQGDTSKAPCYAETPNAFIPTKDRHGWYRGIRRDKKGPVLATRVLIDSVAAQSGRAETALWEFQDDLSLVLPGIRIVNPDPTTPKDLKERQLADALSVEISTWTAPHRQADAWVRYACEPDAGLVWQQTEVDKVKSLITSTSAATGEELYRNFPNSALYGYWLSSGTPARHKLPRAYSSEIVGYGAYPVITGTTKLDAAGGASEDSLITFDTTGNMVVKNGAKAQKPSTLGFGQVPSQPTTTGYVCELILQQSHLSFAVLRSLAFKDQCVKNAALTVLTLLGMLGHYLAGRGGFLRSGCSLVPVKERWGWIRRGSNCPDELTFAGIKEIKEALLESIEVCNNKELSFAAPIYLHYSKAEMNLIRERVAKEAADQSSEKQ